MVLGDLKPKRKKKKKKSVSKPKMMSALEMARNPQPYQVPLYMPPFPAVKPRQTFEDNKKVSNLLRNYVGVQKKELARLRGDLTAYRQEAQTAMKQQVAFPRATVDVGSFGGESIGDDNSVVSASDISSATTAAEPDSDFTPPTSSDTDSTASFGDADKLVESMRRLLVDSSESEGALFKKAGAGAGRLTEPEMTTDTQFSPTDVSDFEGLTSGTSVGRSKRVRFGEPMDLTEPESDFAPRASRAERASRRERRYVDNASNRRLGRVGKSY